MNVKVNERKDQRMWECEGGDGLKAAFTYLLFALAGELSTRLAQWRRLHRL